MSIWSECRSGSASIESEFRLTVTHVSVALVFEPMTLSRKVLVHELAIHEDPIKRNKR